MQDSRWREAAGLPSSCWTKPLGGCDQWPKDGERLGTFPTGGSASSCSVRSAAFFPSTLERRVRGSVTDRAYEAVPCLLEARKQDHRAQQGDGLQRKQRKMKDRARFFPVWLGRGQRQRHLGFEMRTQHIWEEMFFKEQVKDADSLWGETYPSVIYTLTKHLMQYLFQNNSASN